MPAPTIITAVQNDGIPEKIVSKPVPVKTIPASTTVPTSDPAPQTPASVAPTPVPVPQIPASKAPTSVPVPQIPASVAPTSVPVPQIPASVASTSVPEPQTPAPEVPTSVSAPQTSAFVVPTSDSAPQTSAFVVPTSFSAPQTSAFVVPTSFSAPQTSDFVVPTSFSAPQTSDFVVPTSDSAPQTSASVVPISVSAPKTSIYLEPLTVLAPEYSDPLLNLISRRVILDEASAQRIKQLRDEFEIMAAEQGGPAGRHIRIMVVPSATPKSNSGARKVKVKKLASIEHVTHLPIVEDAMSAIELTYNKVKKSNCLVKLYLNMAESIVGKTVRISGPLRETVGAWFSGPISLADNAMLRSMLLVEEIVPVITLPSDQIMEKAKHLVSANYIKRFVGMFRDECLIGNEDTRYSTRGIKKLANRSDFRSALNETASEAQQNLVDETNVQPVQNIVNDANVQQDQCVVNGVDVKDQSTHNGANVQQDQSIVVDVQQNQIIVNGVEVKDQSTVNGANVQQDQSIVVVQQNQIVNGVEVKDQSIVNEVKDQSIVDRVDVQPVQNTNTPTTG